MGLNADTSRLNNDVAVKVAVTLTTDVIAAADTISALGTGISISNPGTVIVVASANCGESDKAGFLSGIWYCGTWTLGVGATMGGAAFSGGFLSCSSSCPPRAFTRTPLLKVSPANGKTIGVYEGTSAFGSSNTGAGKDRGSGSRGAVRGSGPGTFSAGIPATELQTEQC